MPFWGTSKRTLFLQQRWVRVLFPLSPQQALPSKTLPSQQTWVPLKNLLAPQQLSPSPLASLVPQQIAKAPLTTLDFVTTVPSLLVLRAEQQVFLLKLNFLVPQHWWVLRVLLR